MNYRFKSGDIYESSFSAVPSPELNVKKRFPIGWLLLTIFLAGLCVFFWFQSRTAQSAVADLNTQIESSYSKGYSEGRSSAYADGKSDGYDEGYSAAKKEYMVQSYPFNGEVFTFPSYKQTCPFTVNTAPSSYSSFSDYSAASNINYYIRLEYMTSDELPLLSGYPYFTSIHEGASYARTLTDESLIVIPGIGDGISFYVCAGCSVDVDVPPGIYRLWYCCGDEWYGEKFYFGDGTQWYSSDEPLLFYETSSGFVGNTISLYKTSDGNFSTYEVSDEDVPFLA